MKGHGHRQLVVILDNLDRLQETQSRGGVSPDEQLFLGQASQLLAMQCHVIYTMRLALAHAQEANLLVRYGRVPVIVPMIPVRQRDGTTHVAGMAKLREVIKRRLQVAGTDLQHAFSNGSTADRLCHACGGHLRELMTLVQSACEAAIGAKHDLPLTEADVKAAILSLRALRRLSAGGYEEALRRVAQNHRLDGLPPEVQQALLHYRLIYEYFDGEYWYDISPLLSE